MTSPPPLLVQVCKDGSEKQFYWTPVKEGSVDRIIVGIDPGLTMTGVAAIKFLEDGQKILMWAEHHAPKGDDIHSRVVSLAAATCKRINNLVSFTDPTIQIVVAIEEPVLSRGNNAKSLIKQARVIGALESSYMQVVDTMFIHNKSAKKALTGEGNSDKGAMVANAKAMFPAVFKDRNKAQCEAVADAIGIVLAANDVLAGGGEDG